MPVEPVISGIKADDCADVLALFPGCEFVGLDFESARLRDSAGDVPVQIGMMGTSRGAIDWTSVWATYLQPPAPVHPGPGLRDPQLLLSAPELLQCWPELRRHLAGRILLAHGAGTEKRFLRAFPGHGFGPWIDTLRLARAVLPSAPSHALGPLCAHLGVEETLRQRSFPGDWHDALFDAAACLLLFFALVKQAGVGVAHGGEDLLDLLARPELRDYFKVRRIRSACGEG